MIRLRRKIDSDEGLLLTPLIDMIFLVVIFFMLNTTLSINPAVQVQLPDAYTAQAVLDKQVVVTIDRGGEIYIGRKAVERDRFAAELKKEMVRLGTMAMILQADQELPYRRLVEVIDLARLSGVEELSLVTETKSLPE